MADRVTSVRSGFFELPDGVELYFERHGEGRPIVLIHGLFGVTEHWQFQTPVLSRDSNVLAYDLRGSGRSTKPDVDEYTIFQHVEDLSLLLQHVGVDAPAVLVGHSMGSCIAIEFALTRPDRVEALALVDGFACGEHCLVAYEQMREGVSKKATLVSLFKDVSFGESFRWNPEGERLSEWCALEAAKLPLSAILASARGFSAYDSRPRLGAMNQPTLVAVGDQDWSCPLDPSSQFLADTIPNSRLEVLHSGHFPILEVPTAFNELFASFLESVSRRSFAA